MSLELDEPPRSDAGQDVMIQLPTDWTILDGRDSMDDHGVTRYEWALMKGDPSVNMKVNNAMFTDTQSHKVFLDS